MADPGMQVSLGMIVAWVGSGSGACRCTCVLCHLQLVACNTRPALLTAHPPGPHPPGPPADAGADAAADERDAVDARGRAADGEYDGGQPHVPEVGEGGLVFYHSWICTGQRVHAAPAPSPHSRCTAAHPPRPLSAHPPAPTHPHKRRAAWRPPTRRRRSRCGACCETRPACARSPTRVRSRPCARWRRCGWRGAGGLRERAGGGGALQEPIGWLGGCSQRLCRPFACPGLQRPL